MKIVGVDPSLTATGVAVVNQHGGRSYLVTDVVRPTPLPKKRAPKTVHEQLDRVLEIVAEVKVWVGGADVLVMEGAAFSRVGGLQEERYWLRGLVLSTARRNDVEVVIVSPTTLKFYATGRGDSDKEAMLAAARTQFPGVEIEDDNAADAMWLACLAARRLGVAVDDVPEKHHKALNSIAWPDFGRAA